MFRIEFWVKTDNYERIEAFAKLLGNVCKDLVWQRYGTAMVWHFSLKGGVKHIEAVEVWLKFGKMELVTPPSQA